MGGDLLCGSSFRGGGMMDSYSFNVSQDGNSNILGRDRDLRYRPLVGGYQFHGNL